MTAAAFPPTAIRGRPGLGRTARLSLGLIVLAGILALVVLASLLLGTHSVAPRMVLRAFTEYDPAIYDQVVVRELRLPRTLIGLCVGAALALAGAVIQAVTRNPLGDPGVLGVNAGAAGGVVFSTAVAGLTSSGAFAAFAFAGALAASLTVLAVAGGSAGQAHPARLALAGAVVASLLGSWTTAMLLLDQRSLDVVRFWLAGSLVGRDISLLLPLLPWFGLGAVLALGMGRALDLLALGEDAARAAGMRTGRARLGAVVSVVLLSGASVAIAGPIGFIGLATPHAVRGFTGPDHRWLLPYCIVTGPILLLGADIAGRLIIRPSEVQAGIITAMAGAPLLIAIARYRRLAGW